MNKTDPAGNESPQEPEPPPSPGPSLVLLYGLLAAAVLVAIVLAAFIVLPFYHRH